MNSELDAINAEINKKERRDKASRSKEELHKDLLKLNLSAVENQQNKGDMSLAS